jgi:hypothetical protein
MSIIEPAQRKKSFYLTTDGQLESERENDGSRLSLNYLANPTGMGSTQGSFLSLSGFTGSAFDFLNFKSCNGSVISVLSEFPSEMNMDDSMLSTTKDTHIFDDGGKRVFFSPQSINTIRRKTTMSFGVGGVANIKSLQSFTIWQRWHVAIKVVSICLRVVRQFASILNRSDKEMKRRVQGTDDPLSKIVRIIFFSFLHMIKMLKSCAYSLKHCWVFLQNFGLKRKKRHSTQYSL